MLADITEDVLDENFCKTLSLTGVNVVPNVLHACHRMKRSHRVTVKFKCRKRKNSIMYKRKNLGDNSQEPKDFSNLKSSGKSNLKFSGKRFLS